MLPCQFSSLKQKHSLWLGKKKKEKIKKLLKIVLDLIKFVRVQALLLSVSDFCMLLGIKRRNFHIFEVSIVSTLIVTHHDFRLHFTACRHIRAGGCGSVHRHGHVVYRGCFKVWIEPQRVWSVRFSVAAAAPGGGLRFWHVCRVVMGKVLDRKSVV